MNGMERETYEQHVEDTVTVHGHHSDTSCPPGTRAMCSYSKGVQCEHGRTPPDSYVRAVCPCCKFALDLSSCTMCGEESVWIDVVPEAVLEERERELDRYKALVHGSTKERADAMLATVAELQECRAALADRDRVVEAVRRFIEKPDHLGPEALDQLRSLLDPALYEQQRGKDG